MTYPITFADPNSPNHEITYFHSTEAQRQAAIKRATKAGRKFRIRQHSEFVPHRFSR